MTDEVKRGWVSPSVMWIESAADSLKQVDSTYYPGMIDDQGKELLSFGDTRAKSVGATGLTTDFIVGYNLGLQVARTLMALSPALIMKGVDPTKVL